MALSPVKTPSKPVAVLEFTLGNISDDILSSIDPDQMRNLPINDHETIMPVSPTAFILVEPSDLFSTPMNF